MAHAPRKTVFITGAAGGLGRSTTELLVEKGWRVIAADFDEAALGRLGEAVEVDPVVLDVTDAASLRAAVERVGELTDGLDGIVNFAGILAVGSMIELPEDTLRRIFEVNVFGTYRVNQALFPLLLERKGRIVNISSETGWQSGAPFNGAYAMTKHAIEAYSDSLRRELRLLGIHVVKVQPGPFRTEMTASIGPNFERAAEQSRYFGDVLRRMLPRAVGAGEHASDPEILAQAVLKALTANPPGPSYSVRAARDRTMLEWLPTPVADRLLYEVLKR
ncbi:MAG: SDR family oxidoreductase [Acidimicrobiales bacterium]|jgi:NAD(P)-dependent dehydrogenase (short-subunit alcohol dehydrogenase family)|nr:SDR family oxidoreductase [Acidimicrobiales bacterium]